MASSQAADGVRSDQSQGGPFSAPLTGDEQQARQDRKDAVDGASAPDDASQGENFVKSFSRGFSLVMYTLVSESVCL